MLKIMLKCAGRFYNSNNQMILLCNQKNNTQLNSLLNICFKYLGIQIRWFGKGINEKAKIMKLDEKRYPNLKKNMIVVKIDKKYLRPNEVGNLIGNANAFKNS